MQGRSHDKIKVFLKHATCHFMQLRLSFFFYFLSPKEMQLKPAHVSPPPPPPPLPAGQQAYPPTPKVRPAYPARRIGTLTQFTGGLLCGFLDDSQSTNCLKYERKNFPLREKV